MIGIFAYLLVTAGAPLMSRPEHFYILAVVIGLGLKKVTSGGGIDYAQATFKVKERLSDADAVAAKEYAKSFGDVVSGFDVADTSG